MAPHGLVFMPLNAEATNTYPLQLVSFSDASYGNLIGHGGIEAGIICLAQPLFRNGPVTCKGQMLHYFPRKLQRKCRSSLSSECMALVTVIEYTPRYKTILVDIYTGHFPLRCLKSSDPLPPMSPFGKVCLNWKHIRN